MTRSMTSAPRAPGWTRWAVGTALLIGGGSAAADDVALAEQLRALAARMQQLEARNAELERQVRALQPAPTPAPAAGAVAAAATAPTVGRAQADVAAAGAPVLFEPDDAEREITIEGGLLAVAQRVDGASRADGESRSALNWRGDLLVAVPVGEVGGAAATAVAHARVGQGGGVAVGTRAYSGVNASAFETAGGSDAFAILAQAYLQLDWQLAPGGFNDSPGDALQAQVGKLDFFGLFDGNEVAADEGSQFVNAAFVHNPLLDLGGDIGADDYGFAPGLRVGYTNVGDGTWRWGASLGVFGAGEGSSFGGSLGRPLVVAQVEAAPLQINGETRANYRLYAWTNGRSVGLDEETEQRHSGWGLSVDQRVGRDWNLFGRWGRRTQGDGAFDRALTLGFEHGGRAWGRGDDALGFAWGWLKTSDEQRQAQGVSGSERVAELYYRVHLNEHLTLSPDLQWIQRPGGDADATDVKAIGLRATLGF